MDISASIARQHEGYPMIPDEVMKAIFQETLDDPNWSGYDLGLNVEDFRDILEDIATTNLKTEWDRETERYEKRSFLFRKQCE